MRDLVTETVRKVAEYVTKFEPVLLYLYAKKNSEATARNLANNTHATTLQERTRVSAIG